jgi:hypothetical protein
MKAQRGVQVLIDCMKNSLPSLRFTTDAFSRGLVDPDTVELILRDVPLPADEVDVCRALSKWAGAYFGDPDSSGELAGYIQIGDSIMKHIDLLYVSRQDLIEVRDRLLHPSML